MCIFSNRDVKNKKLSNSGLFCCILFKHSANYMKMRKLIAYNLQVTGLLAALIFLEYAQKLTPVQVVSLGLCIFIVVLGFGLQAWLYFKEI